MLITDQGLINRFNGKWELDEATGCWLWTASCAGKGYGQIKLSKARKQAYAHRLSYEIHKGPIPEGMDVCHTCDTPRCVNPEHLFVGTRSDNLQDMKAKDRHLCGEKNNQHKLTEEQVLQVKMMLSIGIPERKIGHVFDVSQGTVHKIKNGVRWNHLN